MTTWRLRLRPRAPWATPLRADSLFGAICWRWLELFPETFDSMLDGFLEGDPPFVLSDAFPNEFMPMPMPMHAKIPAAEKKLRPPLYVHEASLRNLMHGGLATASSILERAIGDSSRVQTAIDRDSGTASDGQLFETDTQHLPGPDDVLSVYIRSNRHFDEVIACFKALEWTGFGKKSSTGLGAFQNAGMPERCQWLDQLPGANAFMALSHFVPAQADPISGYWRTHVTFPKFHANAVSNVFKGSILMLAPGSVFRTNADAPRPWYGSMIPLPRPEMPKAVHYGLCFSAPLVWAEELV